MRQSKKSIHAAQFNIELGQRGRLVLPALLRKQLGIEAGDQLILAMDDYNSVRLTTRKALAAKFRGKYKSSASKSSLVDELIAERRLEAAKE
jgi:bifunctional DNA-binding transcriptional regulator/antitoxin component of YhaV-PrlF toxin-antitoxin module